MKKTIVLIIMAAVLIWLLYYSETGGSRYQWLNIAATITSGFLLLSVLFTGLITKNKHY